jgi:23S rRNA pseudouridine2605 synthase
VRRLMEAVGLTIHSLKRVAFGPLELNDLPRGSWRSLEPGEIDSLRALNRIG